jgi:hypothetical protein
VYTIVGIVIANEIDQVYHMASTMVYRHNCTCPGRGFVGAVQDVVVVCNPAEYGIGLESASGVETTGRAVDVELLEGGMTSPKELRGLLSSLNCLSAFFQTQPLDSETYDP